MLYSLPHSYLIAAYLFAVVGGLLLAWFLTGPAELRSMRLTQLVVVPSGMVLCVCSFDAAPFLFPVLVFALGVVLAPNIAYYCGIGLSNFLDPQDWTPTEEEIALRPIRLLIDRDNYRQALGELDELFKKHKPTYEAVLLKAKLLNHIGRVDEARSALLDLIALSNGTAQQLTVMETLAFLDENQQEPPKPPVPGTRRIEIYHDLVLFRTDGDDPPLHKEVPPGSYEVGEIIHRNRLWLKLTGEDFGNAEMCWEAIQGSGHPPVEPAKKGLLWRIARMNQAVSIAIKGKPHRQRMAESRDFFREASEFIRRDDWKNALPLLQKASASNPDRFEIAYRWVEAVRRTSNAAATAEVVGRVLEQSQWSKNEEEMLKQLKRPLAR
jgi:tetratricopeptide (TPR) repeat protein